MPLPPLELDLVIFGGGIAGLWLLDAAHRRGYRVVLLESGALGQGQTSTSQGIIHGGMKYSLRGLVSPSARTIRDMPDLWRRALAGESEVDLRDARLRAEYCHLWHGRSLRSRLAMSGARAGLRTVPQPLDPAERPDILRTVPGRVARLDEQVIEPQSVIQLFAHRHEARLLKIDSRSGVEFEQRGDQVTLVRLLNPDSGEPLDLRPKTVVLTAGAGNEKLRDELKLTPGRTQRRPLHMVVARGDSLPMLNGHCVDGMHTRATITTTTDLTQRRVWQIGGQIAEDGVRLSAHDLIRHTQRELAEVLPGLDLSGLQWMTYPVDRAERRAAGGGRPEDISSLVEGNVISAWPTKLALAPQLADRIIEQMRTIAPAPSAATDPAPDEHLQLWPRPAVALAPWEDERSWISDH